MINISVDFHRLMGRIKPMHAVGQPPMMGGFLKLDFSHVQYLKDAGVPFSRLHDVGGPFGGNCFVDIPNLFRDFDADENDPDAYDFAFTDELIKALYGYGIEPVFRLGVTIENQAHIKAYRIHPPKDFAKWARICEHVIRHYNEGWANGFAYGIQYWEIWNEPENGVAGQNQMWTGTAQQFYELYDVTAKHLKACFGNRIKVGGYGASGLYGIYYHPDKFGIDVPKREPDERYEKDLYRVEFFNGFLDYIKSHNTPIDFFSWHSYANEKKTLVMDEYIHKVLDRYGYGDLERHLNEWNNAHETALFGTSRASAANAAMMCVMQGSHTHVLCYYDTRISAGAYSGFFAPLTYAPVCTYYAFVMFNELYTLKNQVACEVDGEQEDFYVLAAGEGDRGAIMLVNYSEEQRQVKINVDGNWGAYLLDEDHFITPMEAVASDLTVGANQVILLKNY